MLERQAPEVKIRARALESQNEAVHAAIDALRVQKSVLAAQFFELFGLARLYLELLSQVSRHTTELALTIYHKSIHNLTSPVACAQRLESTGGCRARSGASL